MNFDLRRDFELESLKLDGAKPRVDTACEKCVYGSGEHAVWCALKERVRITSHVTPEGFPMPARVVFE